MNPEHRIHLGYCYYIFLVSYLNHKLMLTRFHNEKNVRIIGVYTRYIDSIVNRVFKEGYFLSYLKAVRIAKYVLQILQRIDVYRTVYKYNSIKLVEKLSTRFIIFGGIEL